MAQLRQQEATKEQGLLQGSPGVVEQPGVVQGLVVGVVQGPLVGVEEEEEEKQQQAVRLVAKRRGESLRRSSKGRNRSRREARLPT